MPHHVPHHEDRAERTAGAVLAARIAEQTARLADLATAVRADEPDAVHQMRITCRRLRSTLRVFRRLLPDDRGAAAELAWLGGALGRARDCEVLGERLLAHARELPADAGRDQVVADLVEWEREQLRLARPEVLAAVDGPRFAGLLVTLAGLAAAATGPQPPGRARRPAGPELARAVRREHRRTARRVEAVDRAGPGDDTDLALHEARKAAKRARYTGETAGPAADRFTRRMKALQEVLGRHQDAVVACHALRDLSDGGFGYGVLYGRQLAAADRAREEFPAIWRKARRRPHGLGG
ncbi:CHAD domain-containing protein [Kitasatospora sp. NPDC048540]|uniref:CHAD domain-containing protein n=1 Tax=Kitasatospora sp. NPDC048540 TaxID=3155634 RepID=UPI003401B6E2